MRAVPWSMRVVQTRSIELVAAWSELGQKLAISAQIGCRAAPTSTRPIVLSQLSANHQLGVLTTEVHADVPWPCVYEIHDAAWLSSCSWSSFVEAREYRSYWLC